MNEKSIKNALTKQKDRTWADVAKGNAVFNFTTKTNTNASASAKTNAHSAIKKWTKV